MRLLMIGGSGMLGSWTAVQAAETGWETWATYSGHPVEIPGCRMLRLDITDSEQVRDAVGSVGPDAVIHCADHFHIRRHNNNNNGFARH